MRYYEVTGNGPNGPAAVVVQAIEVQDAINKAANQHSLYAFSITSIRLVPTPAVAQGPYAG